MLKRRLALLSLVLSAVACAQLEGPSRVEEVAAVLRELDAGTHSVDAGPESSDAGIAKADAGTSRPDAGAGEAGPGFLQPCTTSADCTDPLNPTCYDLGTDAGRPFCTRSCTDNAQCPTPQWAFCVAGTCMRFCTTYNLACPPGMVCPNLTGSGAGACVPR